MFQNVGLQNIQGSISVDGHLFSRLTCLHAGDPRVYRFEPLSPKCITILNFKISEVERRIHLFSDIYLILIFQNTQTVQSFKKLQTAETVVHRTAPRCKYSSEILNSDSKAFRVQVLYLTHEMFCDAVCDWWLGLEITNRGWRSEKMIPSL